jgi:hypothetical protein
MPFKVPTLAEITYHYLGLFNTRALQKDYDRAEQQFQSALQRVGKGEEIREALALDTTRRLPVQLKSPAYERLIAISGRTPALLREYAQELYDYGPEWNHYADQLWDEANSLDNLAPGIRRFKS